MAKKQLRPSVKKAIPQNNKLMYELAEANGSTIGAVYQLLNRNSDKLQNIDLQFLISKHLNLPLEELLEDIPDEEAVEQ